MPFALFDWLARWIVTSVLGLSLETHLGASLHFFFYDVPKVMTLLLFISLAVGTLQTWLQPVSVRRWLGGGERFSAMYSPPESESSPRFAVAPPCLCSSAF